MYIIGNWKTQEAKNKIIHNHKHFTDWHVLLSLLCVFSQLSFPFYVIKVIHICIRLFHTRWMFTVLKSQSYFCHQLQWFFSLPSPFWYWAQPLSFYFCLYTFWFQNFHSVPFIAFMTLLELSFSPVYIFYLFILLLFYFIEFI